jgi:hypothetical protein
MFQATELTRLQTQKKLLVLQSRANRLLLASEWQQLRSAERWREDALRLVKQHPILTATLATAAGVMAVGGIRQPAATAGSLGRLGQLATLAFSIWKHLRRNHSIP